MNKEDQFLQSEYDNLPKNIIEGLQKYEQYMVPNYDSDSDLQIDKNKCDIEDRCPHPSNYKYCCPYDSDNDDTILDDEVSTEGFCKLNTDYDSDQDSEITSDDIMPDDITPNDIAHEV